MEGVEAETEAAISHSPITPLSKHALRKQRPIALAPACASTLLGKPCALEKALVKKHEGMAPLATGHLSRGAPQMGLAMRAIGLAASTLTTAAACRARP
jgi:hypothetical protein